MHVLMAVLLWGHGYYAATPDNRTNDKWEVVRTFDGSEASGCEAAAAWFVSTRVVRWLRSGGRSLCASARLLPACIQS